MKNKKTLFLTEAAVIAAIYTVLVLIFQVSSFGPVQFRVAEALTVLPYFTPAAIPGVTIGCFLSAVVSGADILDMIFGSLATLIAAMISYLLRRYKFLVPIPPIIVNTLVVPWILKYAYVEFAKNSIPVMMLTVGLGELIAAGILGTIVILTLEKMKHIIFRNYK